MMKMVADLYLATTHFLFSIEQNEGFYCDSCGWEKPPELEKNERDLIALLPDIELDFSINECHITPP